MGEVLRVTPHKPDCIPDASYTGVDFTPLDDPNKLWRCDECGAVGTSAQLNGRQCDCEAEETGTHWKGCEYRPMELTKGEFVTACEGGAAAVIDTYRWCIEEEGMTSDAAKEIAVDEARESAACFAGIGSCYGGGCKHA